MESNNFIRIEASSTNQQPNFSEWFIAVMRGETGAVGGKSLFFSAENGHVD